MFDLAQTWSRMMAAGMTMGRTGARAVETIQAANTVIAARTPLINAAVLSPLTADHQELGRMIPEKVDAFTQAGSAAVVPWQQAQAAWLDHARHVSAMAMRGRPPTLFELIDLNQRGAQVAVQTIEAMARSSERALAPVHGKATANARRLSNKKPR